MLELGGGDVMGVDEAVDKLVVVSNSFCLRRVGIHNDADLIKMLARSTFSREFHGDLGRVNHFLCDQQFIRSDLRDVSRLGSSWFS